MSRPQTRAGGASRWRKHASDAYALKRTCRACLKAAADEEQRLSAMRRTPSLLSLWANAAP